MNLLNIARRLASDTDQFVYHHCLTRRDHQRGARSEFSWWLYWKIKAIYFHSMKMISFCPKARRKVIMRSSLVYSTEDSNMQHHWNDRTTSAYLTHNAVWDIRCLWSQRQIRAFPIDIRPLICVSYTTQWPLSNGILRSLITQSKRFFLTDETEQNLRIKLWATEDLNIPLNRTHRVIQDTH